ncbi:hypothetical protein LTR28_006363 [Elasticomyces elasticus]|nr:hypothetical protein LTR28_006363 [Elasticomyces elasticus]
MQCNLPLFLSKLKNISSLAHNEYQALKSRTPILSGSSPCGQKIENGKAIIILPEAHKCSDRTVDALNNNSKSYVNIEKTVRGTSEQYPESVLDRHCYRDVATSSNYALDWGRRALPRRWKKGVEEQASTTMEQLHLSHSNTHSQILFVTRLKATDAENTDKEL